MNRTLTIGEASALTAMSRSTLRRAIERGELRAWHTPGGHNRIETSDLGDFIAKTGRSADHLLERAVA